MESKKYTIKGLVSIIVPVYNKEQYIEECCLELRKQTYRNYEIIIVDDGSKDNSPAICDLMAEKYSCVKVYHTPNRGVSAARNFGMSKASGEWLMFVDADDYPLPSMAEQMVKETADLVICNWTDEVNVLCSKSFPQGKKVCCINEDAEYLLCNPDFFKTIWNKLYKHSIIHENQLHFEEEICHAEDALFSLDYFNSLKGDGKIVIINESLYFHRMEVKGSLVKDYNVSRWKKSNEYWWRHLGQYKFPAQVRKNMEVRCLQNEFFVYAMERSYKGLRITLKHHKNLISKESVKYWSRIQRLVLLSKCALIIYLANIIWIRIRKS